MECPNGCGEMEAVDNAVSATTGEIIGTTFECECGEIDVELK